MGKGGQTLGYHYIMTLVSHFGRGPVDEMVQVDVGGEVAWVGSVTDDTATAINRPDLFGGEKREGGIQGAFRLLQGASDQILPVNSSTVSVGFDGPVRTTFVPGLRALIGGKMGDLRGIATVVFDGLVSSMSPYPKEWKYRFRRALGGWYGGTPWYPAKAVITMTADGGPYKGDAGHTSDAIINSGSLGTYTVATLGGDRVATLVQAHEAGRASNTTIKAMNPAHIIYQCKTDPLWGAGEPASRIDENSFIAAANTLCDEGFGLCFLWSRQEEVDQFIQVVVDHIAGAIYLDPQSGKWALRLIRDDYDIDDLPIYTLRSGLLDIVEEDNAGAEEGYNEIRVTGRDPVTDDPFEVAAQSNAALQDPDVGTIFDSREYKGIPTRALALRVAERDLRPYAAGLKRYKLRFDRRAWAITPAMPIRVQVPERGIADIVLRLGDIDYGSPEKPEITARAVEDQFGMRATSFSTAVGGSGADVPTIALPSPRTQLVEANYRDLYRTIGQTEAQGVAATSAVIGQFALAPTQAALNYDLASQAAGESGFTRVGEQPFTAWGDLAADIGPLDTEITLAHNFGIDDSLVGEALHIGAADGEIVRVEAVDGDTLTIARGCVDTVPASHAAGEGVWPLDDTHGLDGREYAAGEDVTTMVLPRTRNALLADDDADPETITLEGRHAMPYGPGNVEVDGTLCYVFDAVHEEPELTWAHRDRIAQADQLVAFEEGSVGPEPTTTYRVRVYDPDDLATPLRTETGISGTTWTYDSTMQTADSPPPRIVFRVDAEREGLNTWQPVQFEVQIMGGYGYAYGMDYGGA